MEDFFVRALLGGIGIAITAGPLGCFILWKRMAYFGDALSHFSLLGIVFGLLFHINMTVSLLLVAALFAFLLIMLQKKRTLTSDTALSILAHSGLAIGLVVISFLHDIRVDLMAYLFGDILAINNMDIILIYTGMVAVLGWLLTLWRPLLLAAIHEDLAYVQGINVTLVHIQFMLLVAILVALSIKLVGILLVSALLIIPAAAARNFATTPEKMAFFAVIAGVLSVVLGLQSSLKWDTPSGPSIVVSALVIFIFSTVAGKYICKKNLRAIHSAN